MKARLPTSHRWTNLPAEYSALILELFQKEFEPTLASSKIIFDGRIYPEEIILRLAFIRPGEIRQNNFEVSLDYEAQNGQVMEIIHTGVDCLASILKDFLQEESELPRTWTPLQFERKDLYFQYHTENSELEAEANRWLSQLPSEGLVHEDQDFEDPMDNLEPTEEEMKTLKEKFLRKEDEDEDNAKTDEDTESESDDPRRPKIFSSSSRSLTSPRSSAFSAQKSKEPPSKKNKKNFTPH